MLRMPYFAFSINMNKYTHVYHEDIYNKFGVDFSFSYT